MKNGNTSHWERVKTRHGSIWIDPAELERAKARGRKLIKCWKRKNSDSETLHIENIIDNSAPTKQQVDVTLKISLWLDARMEVDAITTLVRSSLPLAFGDALTDMENPVDIIDIKEEAEIYGNK